MLKVIVCGATGYTGVEIIKLLLKHPEVKIAGMSAKIDKPVKMSDEFPELKGIFDEVVEDKSIQDLLKIDADLVFLALPHTVSMEFAPHFLKKGMKVIDLSADFRLDDLSVYEKSYKHKHSFKEYIGTAVYGLPELYKDKIKKTKLLANPGCFPTASILSLAPLMDKIGQAISDVIIDAKTGVTGAGRKAALAFHFSELSDNMWAYKVGAHQHAPEINQELSKAAKKNITALFVPHLSPMKRGILATVYVSMNKKNDFACADIIKWYKAFYKNAPFVRIYEEGTLPKISGVLNSNFCDIGIAKAGEKIVIISCIDNLLKGAAGQAVQNMNIMCGFKEEAGLL
ncbi:MAG: N-acetyl-gamma-glutamyl-phosphate reductase [Candidatus Omnitrophica bacterium]|nr:N-acetyl-gamma-glutamyl-phosphate reductase [Candidatus Omnitrophota bacterium]